ncbi:MAG: tRNA adenosine(34) deaminase TadA [Myxococcota bacterium]
MAAHETRRWPAVFPLTSTTCPGYLLWCPRRSRRTLFDATMNDDSEFDGFAENMSPAGDSRGAEHLPFMQQALHQADAAAALGEVPIGAVVVRDGHIVSMAHNRRELDSDPAGHAELIAMREAARVLGDWRLEGCTVYVTLEPCPMCAGAMVLARIDRCVYGCTDPKGGFLGTLADLSAFPGLNHRFEVVGGVLAEPSSAKLKSFFRALRSR